MAWTDDQRRSLVGQLPFSNSVEPPKPNAFGDAAGASANPGMRQVSAPAPVAAAPVSAPTSAPAVAAAPAQGTLSRNLAQHAQQPAVAPAPSAAAPNPSDSIVGRAFSNSSQSNSVRFDPATNTYSGGNVAGDISLNGAAPSSSGLMARAFGNPSPAAAPAPSAGQSLIDRAFTPQTERQGLPQFQAPQVSHSGNDWEARNNLRNLEVSASSITNNGGRYSDQRGRGMSDAQQAYLGALNADLAARGEQPRLDMATTQVNAGLQREGLEQAGNQQRSLVQAAMDQQRGQNDLTRTTMTEEGANQRAVLQTLGGIQEAQLRANAAKSPPPGYRSLPNGNLQAIPGGPADLSVSKEGQQQTKDTQDVFSILDQARPLLDTATGSYAGAAADQVARAFGVSTDGAQSAAQLKALQGALVSKMPKMSGPQSDKDVLLYREMAGQIGDPTIPVDQRKAAMKTVEDLNMKYLPVASDATAYQAIPSGSYFKTADGSVRRKQ